MSPKSANALDEIRLILEMTAFLRNDPCIAKINFRYHVGENLFYHIHSGDYRTIGLRIAHGAIDIKKGSFKDSESFGGMYNSLHDRLTTRFPTSGLRSDTAKGIVVHECTHAIMDMQVMKPSFPDFEICSYLAQAVWSSEVRRRRRFSQWTISSKQNERIKNSPQALKNAGDAGDIHGAANRIVERYDMTRKRVSLYRHQADELRQALRRHDIYRGNMDKTAWTDGIPPTRPDIPESRLEWIREKKFRRANE